MEDVIKQALAPFAPHQSEVHVRVGDGLNDDDLYVVHIASKKVLDHFGCKSVLAEAARQKGMRVGIGTALVTGMQARIIGVKA